jgi:hypothetical protein
MTFKKLQPKLFLTKVDIILLPFVLKEAEHCSGITINSLCEYLYPIMIRSLREANKAVSGRCCNDISQETFKALTRDQWTFFMVDYNHFNRSLDEIAASATTYPLDFILFSFYIHRLENLVII